jgi:hypothetical protein
MRARPAGPAQSSVFRNSARRGPTKAAHRRAIYSSDGLLRSVAERLTSANEPRLAPTGPPPTGDPSGEGSGDPYGDLSGGSEGGGRIALERSSGPLGIAASNSTTVTAQGPKSASARPGPCTRPRSADALTRREYHPARPGVKVVPPRRRRRPAATARRPTGGCGGSTLTPGRAGWSRGHGSGVPPSAQRHPPGEGAAAPSSRRRYDLGA